MPVTINGSGGIASNDGSAAAPPVRGTDSNTGVFFPAADTIAFAEGGAEVARFDSSGNFGLGTTPPATFSGYTSINLSATSLYNYSVSGNRQTHILNNGAINSAGNAAYINTDPASRIYMTNGSIQFGVAGSGTAGNNISFTTAMTLDSSGNLLVGTTSTPSSSNPGVRISTPGNNFWTSYNSGTAAYDQFIFGNANGIVGRIQTSASSTSFLTSSDYRLKHDIQPMTGALAKVAALKPVTYKWNADGKEGQGFIAHELQEVVPDCVSGEKDAVDAEGNPVYQGIDTSFLVATLTAAIQELKAELDTAKARIAALEAA